MSALSPYQLPSWTFPVFFGTGLVAGFVDSIAGGGGLITLPVMLSIGLPPQTALGTNKLQSTFVTGSAAWHHTQSKVVSLAECWRAVSFTLIGAVTGTPVAERMAPNFLQEFIPVILQ